MKSARIIAQEIAEILKGDVVAAVQVKDHFAQGELMTLLGLTDTVAQARIDELEGEVLGARLFVQEQQGNIGALRDSLASARLEVLDFIEQMEDVVRSNTDLFGPVPNSPTTLAELRRKISDLKLNAQ